MEQERQHQAAVLGVGLHAGSDARVRHAVVVLGLGVVFHQVEVVKRLAVVGAEKIAQVGRLLGRELALAFHAGHDGFHLVWGERLGQPVVVPCQEQDVDQTQHHPKPTD